ncbi:hypothetical protein AB3S75_048130 [Citrus x aurantiifolia]
MTMMMERSVGWQISTILLVLLLFFAYEMSPAAAMNWWNCWFEPREFNNVACGNFYSWNNFNCSNFCNAQGFHGRSHCYNYRCFCYEKC